MANIIHWAQAVSGDFADAAGWSGASFQAATTTPGSMRRRAAFTVTSSVDERVEGLDTASNATLLLTGGVFTALDGTDGGANSGLIAVQSGATLAVGDSLVNSGAITLAGDDRLIVGSVADREVDLSGGGTVSLNGAGARIVGSAQGGALFNLDNTISGVGYVGLRGVDTLEIVNFAGGVIEAAGPGSLVLQASGAMSNAGKLAATGGGTLVIKNTILGQSGAGWLFADAGSRIKLENTEIVGGLLASEYTGSIEVIGQGNVLDGGSAGLTINGLLVVGGGDRLTLSGDIAILYRLELSGGGAAGSRDLVISDEGVTLSGYGKLILGSGGMNRIYGQSDRAILLNQRTYISGAGLIGDGVMTLVNGPSGRITGDQSSPLVIDTGANPIINAGVIQAVNKGVTIVDSLLDNTGTLDTKRGGALTVEAAVTGAGQRVPHGRDPVLSVELRSGRDLPPGRPLRGRTRSGPVTTLRRDRVGVHRRRRDLIGPAGHRLRLGGRGEFCRRRQGRPPDGERWNAHGRDPPERRLSGRDVRGLERRGGGNRRGRYDRTARPAPLRLSDGRSGRRPGWVAPPDGPGRGAPGAHHPTAHGPRLG